MTSSFDGIDGVEAILAELFDEVHKVALDDLYLVAQTSSIIVLVRSSDLVFVVVDPDDLAVAEDGHLARRSAHATAYIEYSHAALEADLRRQVVLVSRNRLLESLAGVITSKVEIL
jgi:hypothetical protein